MSANYLSEPVQAIVEQAKEFLQRNVPSPAPLSFLAGAGISIPDPSKLPSGKQLIRALLQATTAEDAVKDLMNLTDLERTANRRNNNDFIRFEGLLQVVHEWADPNLKSLDVLCNHDSNW